MTMEGNPHWTIVGVLQAQDELGKCKFVPYVVQPARMLPTHQKLLYMPVV
jgi:hypothetical protein